MRSDRRRRELQAVPSLTGLEEVRAQVERELGVSDWQLVTQENPDALTR
jgi:hypothetical protein